MPQLTLTDNSGNQTIVGGDTEITEAENLAFITFDKYALQGINDNYTNPFGQTVSITSTNKEYANITNTKPYVVKNSIYYFMPIIADAWNLFTAPFDVTNVYVIECASDDMLKTLGTENNADLKHQGKLNADFLSILLNDEYINNDQKTFQYYINKYKSYEVKQGKEEPNIELLEHFTGKNWSANYFLYKSTDVWDYNGTKFTTKWKNAPSATKVTHGNNEHDVLMYKGETYALSFPYMALSKNRPNSGEFDSWTGKFIVLEGFGPQTIDAKNYQETIEIECTEANKAYPKGNATFTELTIPVNNSVYIKGENTNSFVKSENTEETIRPCGGFLSVGPIESSTTE